MSAKILDGKKLTETLLVGIKKNIGNRRLTLAAILAGKDPASEIYVRQKEVACRQVGVGFQLFRFPSIITQRTLQDKIIRIVQNPLHSGIIIQLPLPLHFDAQKILNLIPPEKDPDVLCEKNLAKFYTGTLSILPPVIGSVARLLKNYGIGLRGKQAVVIGAGKLVGLPLTLWLLRQGATVSVVNEFTRDISKFTTQADLLISGVGKPRLINGAMIKKGAIVIDAGTCGEKGKLVGDIEIESVGEKAKYLAPVPGGVGPLTVACLLENFVKSQGVLL